MRILSYINTRPIMIVDSCGSVLKQIHDELEKNANNTLRPHGMTMAQLGVLIALKDFVNEECTLKDMEKILHVAQSTVAGIVARLEKKGLLEGYVDSEDKRIKRIRLTDEGRKCCDDANKNMEEAEKKLLLGLTEQEKKTFQSLLIKVRNTFV